MLNSRGKKNDARMVNKYVIMTSFCSLRRSPLPSSAVVGRSNGNQLVLNKFDSSHQLKTAVSSNPDKMSECSRKIQSMDTPNQKGNNEGFSVGPGFNTFRGVDFVKDGRLNKVRVFPFFQNSHNVSVLFRAFIVSSCVRNLWSSLITVIANVTYVNRRQF